MQTRLDILKQKLALIKVEAKISPPPAPEPKSIPKVDSAMKNLTFEAEVQIAEAKLKELIRAKNQMQNENVPFRGAVWTAKDFRAIDRRIMQVRNRLSMVTNSMLRGKV
jgi:hypothetical protein